MRRTHNSKHHVRPSMSGLPSSDEMGPPRESTRGRISLDTSTSGRSSIDSFNANRRPTESPQDWFGNRTISGDIPELDPAVVHTDLRKQLWDADRERQRLESKIISLQEQLAARPSLPQVQSLEKDFNQLELLWHGTQRENERCMSEIEKGKRRERILEGELAKLVGENWLETLDLAALLNPTSTNNEISSPKTSRPHAASVSNTPIAMINNPILYPQSAIPSPGGGPDNSVSVLPHIEQMRSLILGMDQKLKLQDEKLQGLLGQAKAEAKKYDELAATVSPPT